MVNPKLLLIEDDPSLQILLIDVFDNAGYEVCTAISDDDVPALTNWFQPDVVVICGDSRGTYASGWQLASLLHRDHPALPLVMLTTNQEAVREVGQTERGKLFAAGLSKPFRIDHLLETVANACMCSKMQALLPSKGIPMYNH